MTQRIITFLGDRGAVPTDYEFNGSVYRGSVFAEALRQFCHFDDMLVCVTAKAKEKTWPVLQALGDDRIRPIDIPTGSTTTEMWRTFEIIADLVDEGDSVIFDITHGLRSLPFLVFLFAAYLKSAKSVQIEAIYYGALELQNKDAGTPAPVINLTEFVQMLDWIDAAERFVQTGDGAALSKRIRQVTPSGAKLADDALGRASNSIKQVSQALALARPMEVTKVAATLPDVLRNAEVELADRARPFTVLRQKVSDAYSQFGQAHSGGGVDWRQSLSAQFALVQWYVEKQQFIQAATLMRELVVSCVLFAEGYADLLNKAARQNGENALNNLAEQHKPDPRSALRTPITLKQDKTALADFWGALTDVRNDIAHVGMRADPREAKGIADNVMKMAETLEKLKSEFGL